MINLKFKLKRKEKFNNKVMVDIATLLYDNYNVCLEKIKLSNKIKDKNLNDKLGNVINTEYAFNYLNFQNDIIENLLMIEPRSQSLIQINNDGSIKSDNNLLLRDTENIIKEYFKK